MYIIIIVGFEDDLHREVNAIRRVIRHNTSKTKRAHNICSRFDLLFGFFASYHYAHPNCHAVKCTTR